MFYELLIFPEHIQLENSILEHSFFEHVSNRGLKRYEIKESMDQGRQLYFLAIFRASHGPHEISDHEVYIMSGHLW